MKNENKINIRSIQSNVHNKMELNSDKIDLNDKSIKQIQISESKGVLSTLSNNTSKKKINIANLFNLKDKDKDKDNNTSNKDEPNYIETKIKELSKKLMHTERSNVKLSAIDNNVKTRLIKGSQGKLNKRNTSSKDINMNEASKYSKQSKSRSKNYSMNESTSKSKNKRKSKPILTHTSNQNYSQRVKNDLVFTNEKNDNPEKQRSVHEVHNIYNFYHSNLQNVENYILKKDNLKPSMININSVKKTKNIDWKTFNENQKVLVTNSKNSGEKKLINEPSDLKQNKDYIDFVLRENEALKKKLIEKTKENKELQIALKSFNNTNPKNSSHFNNNDDEESKDLKLVNEDHILSDLDKNNLIPDKKLNKNKIINISKSPINNKLNISECKIFIN